LKDSNSDLIKNIKDGDRHSLELVFRRLYPRLCAYAQKFVQDLDDAEEIVQELFYNVWKNRTALDENQSLDSYMFTSIKNRCLNLLDARRTKSKHAQLLWYLYSTTATENNNAYQKLVADEFEKNLVTAIDNLPKECKKVFELSRFEGLKYQEIAQRLDISIKTVETQMSRALSKLRLDLREYLSFFLLLAIC
jgi:RNA polymerase sigma-70 factor (ECF subfamily)